MTSHTAPVNPVVLGALLLFVISIPFEIPDRTIPLELTTLTGLIFLLSTVLNPSACYRRLSDASIAFGAYLWAFLVVMVVVSVMQRQLAARLFINMTLLVWIFSVMVNLLEHPRVLRATLLAFVLACAARAGLQLLGIATTASEVWTGGARVTTLGQNANLSAIILSAGMVSAIGLARSQLDPPRWLALTAWPLAVALAVAVIQTGSRGGLLCAAVGIAAFCIRGRTPLTRVRNAVLAFAGVAALGIGAWRSDMMRHRLEESAQEGRLAGREVIYPAAWQMALERPWFGWGPLDNQFEIARRIRERDLPRRDAHNLMLELLSATGVVGAIPFLVGLGLTLRHAFRGRRSVAGVLPLALLATVLMGTVSGTWIAAKMLWVALAVAATADRLPPLAAPRELGVT